MFASFRSCGRQCECQQSRKTLKSSVVRATPPHFRTSGGMPSAPGDLSGNLSGANACPGQTLPSGPYSHLDQRNATRDGWDERRLPRSGELTTPDDQQPLTQKRVPPLVGLLQHAGDTYMKSVAPP